MLNLRASIEPSVSAGGFRIGQPLSEVMAVLGDVKVVSYEAGFNLNRAIRENTGVLVVHGLGEATECSIYFGRDAVRLVFSGNGTLGCIYVFEGYLGSYRGASIATPLSLVSASEPIAFDEGDEMYYRVDEVGEYLPGLAIVAAEANLERKPSAVPGSPSQGFLIPS